MAAMEESGLTISVLSPWLNLKETSGPGGQISLGLFIDASANEPQREAMEPVVPVQVCGYMHAFARSIGE